MNYRHIYHAGNFADVFKHSILTLLIQSLLRKEKPFCYLDTHAGIGVYDLFSVEAQKTKEYESGIELLLKCKNHPRELDAYLDVVKKLNLHCHARMETGLRSSGGEVKNVHKPVKHCVLQTGFLLPAEMTTRFYPGSPYIVRNLARPCDRLILLELHKEDSITLKQQFFNDKQVAVHHYDGYQGLKAFLPPKERRGLVLIDPPFENKDEFDHIISSLRISLSRWPTGIYAIWYPIKDHLAVNKFKCDLKSLNIQNILINEMILFEEDKLLDLFIGCGMVIINPPWQIDIQINAVVAWLQSVLTQDLRP